MKRVMVSAVLVLIFVFMAVGRSAYAASQEASLISGKVIETMNSGGYTYVHLDNRGKKVWVAVPEMKIAKGKKMSFQPGAEMVNFESKTLKRRFDRIVFSAGPVK